MSVAEYAAIGFKPLVENGMENGPPAFTLAHTRKVIDQATGLAARLGRLWDGSAIRSTVSCIADGYPAHRPGRLMSVWFSRFSGPG